MRILLAMISGFVYQEAVAKADVCLNRNALNSLTQIAAKQGVNQESAPIMSSLLSKMAAEADQYQVQNVESEELNQSKQVESTDMLDSEGFDLGDVLNIFTEGKFDQPYSGENKAFTNPNQKESRIMKHKDVFDKKDFNLAQTLDAFTDGQFTKTEQNKQVEVVKNSDVIANKKEERKQIDMLQDENFNLSDCLDAITQGEWSKTDMLTEATVNDEAVVIKTGDDGDYPVWKLWSDPEGQYGNKLEIQVGDYVYNDGSFSLGVQRESGFENGQRYYKEWFSFSYAGRQITMYATGTEPVALGEYGNQYSYSSSSFMYSSSGYASQYYMNQYFPQVSLYNPYQTYTNWFSYDPWSNFYHSYQPSMNLWNSLLAW